MTRQSPKALKAYGVLPDADRVIDLGDRDLGPWRPKLVATDLDGTLFTSAGEVGARTRAALDAAIAAALDAVTSADAAGWFTHAGYLTPQAT